MLARYKAQRLFQICSQLIRRPCLARIGSGSHYSAAAQSFAAFKSAHIIALPAVQRYGNFTEAFYRLFGVHAQLSITLTSGLVCLFDRVHVVYLLHYR